MKGYNSPSTIVFLMSLSTSLTLGVIQRDFFMDEPALGGIRQGAVSDFYYQKAMRVSCFACMPLATVSLSKEYSPLRSGRSYSLCRPAT